MIVDRVAVMAVVVVVVALLTFIFYTLRSVHNVYVAYALFFAPTDLLCVVSFFFGRKLMKYNIFDTTGVDVVLKMSKQTLQNKRFKNKERKKTQQITWKTKNALACIENDDFFLIGRKKVTKFKCDLCAHWFVCSHFIQFNWSCKIITSISCYLTKNKVCPLPHHTMMTHHREHYLNIHRAAN